MCFVSKILIGFRDEYPLGFRNFSTGNLELTRRTTYKCNLKMKVNKSLVLRISTKTLNLVHSRTLSGSNNPLAKAASVAALDFNRWRVVPFAVTTHLCIGGLYAWSVLNEPLTRTLGVVSNANGDWVLSSVVPVFSTAVCAAGVTAALSGKWADRVGPRQSIFLAGTLWGGGMMLGGLGVHLQQLGLVYLGYGVLGGIGIGFACKNKICT